MIILSEKIENIFYIIFEKIIANFGIFNTAYINLYGPLVLNEITQAKISKTDNVLVVGCGAVPSTAILLYNKTGANITAIDIDKRAVKKAKKLINRKKYHKYIQINHSDIKNYELISRHSVIIIAKQVEKTDDLLNIIYKNSKNDVKIIFRTYSNKNKNNIENKIKKYFLILNINISYKAVYSYICKKKVV